MGESGVTERKHTMIIHLRNNFEGCRIQNLLITCASIRTKLDTAYERYSKTVKCYTNFIISTINLLKEHEGEIG